MCILVNVASEDTVELNLPQQAVNEMSHSGRCDEDVEFWVEEYAEELKVIPKELIRKCLKTYGAWEPEELLDDEANLRRFLWLAAGQIKDEQTTRQTDETWAYMTTY